MIKEETIKERLEELYDLQEEFIGKTRRGSKASIDNQLINRDTLKEIHILEWILEIRDKTGYLNAGEKK